MPPNIGSVYLDEPRTGSPPRHTDVRTARTVVATLLALLGLTALTVAGVATLARSVAASPDPSVAAVEKVLDDPGARDDLAGELADAVLAGLFGPEVAEAAQGFGFEFRHELEAWAHTVIADERFSAVAADITRQIHETVFQPDGPDAIDATAITAIVLDAAAETAPELSQLMVDGGQVVIVDATRLPDLSGPAGRLDQAVDLGILIGAAGLVSALFVHDHRFRVVAMLARWLLGSGLILAVAAVGLPLLAGAVTGWTIVEAASRALSMRLLAPAVIEGILGMGMLSVAAVWRRREGRKVAKEGAAAWLHVVEPAPFQEPPRPGSDLHQRGLYDGGRQLTNI